MVLLTLLVISTKIQVSTHLKIQIITQGQMLKGVNTWESREAFYI